MSESKRVQPLSLGWISVRILEPITLIYLTACILCYSLYTIRPFISLMVKIGLNPLLRPGLRNIGTALCLTEAVFSLRMRKGPGRFLLYGILAVAAFSSWQQRAYGTEDNCNSILWMGIFFILFYSAVFHFGRKNVRLFSIISYALTLLVWCVACCLSLVQFALQIGKSGPNYATTKWLGGDGFFRNRLTGVFLYPEYGAVFGVMIIFIGIYFIIKVRFLILRPLIAFSLLPVFAYIVLSGSRNPMVAMYIAAFCGSFLLFFKKIGPDSVKGTLVSLGLALLVLLGIHCLYAGTKAIAEKVPGHFHYSQPEPMVFGRGFQSTGSFGGLGSGTGLVRGSALRSNPSSDKADIAVSVSGESKTSADRSASSVIRTRKVNAATQQTDTPGILDRQFKSGDITTGRLRIWKDYLSISGAIGLLGLSPSNNSFYIQEHYPELFICTYIKRVFPERYEKGYVFHTHNGYLHVFVATGFAGLACMLLFFLRCILTVISHIRSSRRLTAEFIISLMVVLTGASSAMFDNEVFFNMNPTSLVFWIALSILMRCAVCRSQAQKRGQRASKARAAAK